MKTRPWCWAVLLLAGTMPVQALAPLWLHIESVTTSTYICRGGETGIFIYLDGLVVMRAAGRDGIVTFLRATAPREATQDLASTLRQNRVGFVQGDCALDIFQPHDFFRNTITWFGKYPRSNTFTVSSHLGGSCPAAENRISEAIQRFMAVALSDPTEREVVEIQLAPTPPCER